MCGCDRKEAAIPSGSEDDWDRLALQVPAALVKRFRNLAHTEERQRGVKLAGTAAVALWVGLPGTVRASLLDWASRVERNPELADSPEAAATVFATILRSLIELRGAEAPKDAQLTEAEPPEENADWFVDRILDPQILLQRTQQRDDTQAGAG